MKSFVASLVLATVLHAAVTAFPRRGQEWHEALGYVPNAAADIVAVTVIVDYLYLANTSGSAVTVILKDRTTNCGGAACQWWPTISIAANTAYMAPTGGIVSTSGVNWVASSASAVVGSLKGTYTR